MDKYGPLNESMASAMMERQTAAAASQIREAFDKAVAAPIAPYEPIRMRRFVFERIKDNSATSGEGTVVEGVQFTDGKVVLKWRTAVSSIVIWDNIESAALIHGHGGDTVIRWIDPPWPELG